jgi:hypothetical protein
MIRRMTRTALAVAALALSCTHARNAPPAEAAAKEATPANAWIARSNANAQLLLDVQARFEPEGAARLGIAGLDEHITDLTPGHRERLRVAVRAVLATLAERARSERDPLVAQDLAILSRAGEREVRGSELSERYEVPYLHVGRFIFGSVRSLLDPQIDKSRYPAAVVRLRKYVGAEPGTTPLATLAENEMKAALANPALSPPSRIDVENELQTSKITAEGIEGLFRQFKLEGADQPLALLREQLSAHDRFLRDEVLPKARSDFRLPKPIYAFALERVGVDIPPEELTALAHQAFSELQGEMQKVAAVIARERHLPSADYRDVIKELKKEQIPESELLAHYQARLKDLERIIAEHDLVTLPSRPARIRLGTPSENAQQPAPHMNPPRLIGNTGEEGEFVLPLSVPGAVVQKYDDFSFSAASWTLTAHEARPGHELQFATMIEKGVSIARATFAFNSVNVEGWGLYAEAISLPYMPPEGQLISLQLRLQRAARAFVDPELQLGKWTPESARAFLQREVGLSPAFATSEVDRYTFRSPAQATAYFYGYTKLLALRKEAEARPGFNAHAFHDLILAQGLLPPDLLRKAVLQP